MEKAQISPGRATAVARDWTKGSIIGSLLSLSWPVMVSFALYMVGQTVDMIWVGKLGAASIAGVGVAGILFNAVMTAEMGFVTGARALVARSVGSGDIESASHFARQALFISAVYGLVMSAVGVAFAEPVLRLFGLQADVVAQGALYMRTILAGWTAMALWFMAFSIMQASGDTVTPMKISILVRSVQIILSPFLVFGWWIFPQMGVTGAALSNVVYQVLGLIFGVWVFSTGRSRLRLTWRNFRPDPDAIWRILKIGIPAGIMGIQANFGQLVLTWFMARFGTYAVAAHSLAQRVEMIVMMPSAGLGTGAGVLTGQNLGAGQPERAERTGWLAVSLLEGLMVAFAVSILLYAENLIRIFNTEPTLVEMGGVFLRIAAAGTLTIGLTSVLQNCISGAGDTLPPMLVGLTMVWAVQIPLAFVLPQITVLGVYGVRWAIVAGMFAGAIAYTTYFRLGRWKRKRV